MADDVRTVAARRLRPWAGMILAVESPVDDEQRDSGLIVPLSTPESEVVRTIVLAAAPDVDVEEGVIVYFKKEDACKVLDTWAVYPHVLLAWEHDD